MKLPRRGLSADDVSQRLAALKSLDLDWRSGRAYAYVYDAGLEVEETGRRAFGEFLFQNALDPTAFPSLLKMENDVVGIALEHLGGDEGSAGTFTSGGTESIMLAVKAARDHARAQRPEVVRPQMVLPITGHAAFHKAAAYLGVEVVPAAVDPVTFAADPEAVRRAITPDTILIVGSAPSYAHGVVDPIPALAELARERSLWLHVDACVGGWLLPYLRRLGADCPDFDLSVPGVTTLSVDLHKYGFAPKGASLLLYRDGELRRHQYFACTEWTGYSVINPTVQSSRSGGPLAAAWAVLQRVGDEGFLELARRVRAGALALRAGIEELPGLRILGRPDFCMVAAASEQVSVYRVVDEMARRGWYLQPQFAYDRSPASIHFSITPKNAGRVEELLGDLRAAVDAAREQEQGAAAEAARAALSGLEPGEVAARFPELLALAGVEGDRLPERMAGVNELLDALPRPLLKEVLTRFLGRMFRPRREEPAGAAR